MVVEATSVSLPLHICLLDVRQAMSEVLPRRHEEKVQPVCFGLYVAGTGICWRNEAGVMVVRCPPRGSGGAIGDGCHRSQCYGGQCERPWRGAQARHGRSVR